MWRCSNGPAPTLVRLAVFAAALLPGTVDAQQEKGPVFVAVDAWLQSDQTVRGGLEAAVQELLAEAPVGLAWLGERLHAASENTPERRKGLETLLAHVTIEFVRRQRASGMRFAGQYDDLRPLQPEVGEFLFGLLLDTPAWYPHSHRDRLVPVLRDLQPSSPGEPRVGRVVALAGDEAVEPEPLRRALAGMLWQWGLREPAQRRLDALRELSAEGDAEDRVRVLLDLAELQYELRDYRSAAATHRAVQAMARASHLRLKPIDHYQSACMHTLIGDVDRALDDLAACAALQASSSVDASLKLERSLFERDPEIELLRRQSRFAAILAKAFPAEGPSTESSR